MSVYTNKRLEQIENELKSIAITKDMYEVWKQNDVTRAFLLDLEGMLIDSQSQSTFGSTVEAIAISEIRRASTVSAFQEVLEWNPITDSE